MSAATVDKLIFDRKEAAAFCSVSEDTIRRATNSGKLRAKRTGKDGGGKYLYTRDALLAWFELLEDA